MRQTARHAALEALYAHAGHLLWRAQARVVAEVARVLPGDFDVHAFATMLALAEVEPASQQHLARLTCVSGTTLGGVADALSRAGLVARVRNPHDRRSYLLTRTAAGRRAVVQWAGHVARLESHLTSALTLEEATRLGGLLRRIVDDQLLDQTPPALTESIGFLLTRAQQRVHRGFLERLEPLGIEPRHFGALRALREAGPITQGTLASLLDVSPATIVTVVDHLEQAGLVSRHRDPTDRRAYLVHLERRAHRVIAEAVTLSDEVIDAELEALSSAERDDLVVLLRRFLAAAPDG